MKDRLTLQKLLEDLLGSRNVYYQPPETIKMEYPAIVYTKTNIETESANNKKYQLENRYEVVVIDKKPDNPVIEKILELPMCSYSRFYKADNLNHDLLLLYY